MSVTVRSGSDQEPAQSIVPRLAYAVTFVPDPADAGPTVGVPMVNGAHVAQCDHPDCNDGGAA